MTDILSYLLKVSAGLAIVGVPYYFLLRNDPNLRLKRFYLMMGLAASWIFPLLVFSKPEIMFNLTPTVFIDPLAADGEILSFGEAIGRKNAGDMTETGLTINWLRLFIWTYLSGMLFMLIKNLVIIIKWNLEWRNRHQNGVAFISTNQVFTLFSRIFIPESLRDERDLENVILHERAHVEQLHFIDLMLMELTLLLTWFNPFSWLISRMIKENHEHLADRQVLSAGISAARYRAQLMNHTLGVNVFRLGNQFNHSLTLNRFKMMKKPKKSPLGIAKLTFLVPVLLIAMALTTGMTPQKEEAVSGIVLDAESGEPMPGTSVVARGVSGHGFTAGTVVDRDGSFSITVPANSELVFSFVGYKTQVIRASMIGKEPIRMETTAATYDLEDVNTGGIKYRASDGVTINKGNSDKDPVIVLDGEVVLEIDNLDPEEIESISVIKDPEHELVKKYGAKDGLIVISTKDGTYVSRKEDTVVKKSGGDPGEEVFYVVEDMPMFPGGKVALKSYIYSNLVYPKEATRKKIEGEVIVQFKVPASGELTDIKVVKSTYEGFDKAAMDVFMSMPDWNPGKQRGKPVAVIVNIPVVFSLD